MKNYFATFLFLSIVFSAASQNAPLIKPVENTNEEIMEVLKLLGARSYRFDLRDLSAGVYEFCLLVDEYVMGKKVEKDFQIHIGPNWRERYPDLEDWNKFLKECKPKLSVDGSKFLSFENLGVYIVPKNDSTSMVGFNFYGGSTALMPLKLKMLENADLLKYILYHQKVSMFRYCFIVLFGRMTILTYFVLVWNPNWNPIFRINP